jgi:spermidine/putrescine transport system permease protein
MAAVAQDAAPREHTDGETRVAPLALALPALAMMLVFFAVPLAVFAVYSILSGALFSVSGPLTTESYADALGSSLTRVLAKNSAIVGLLAATTTIALSLPIAYWLRYVAGRWRTLVLFLITATFFASYLVRIYAWRSILGESGLLNSGLRQIGVIDEPLGFLLYNKFSVTVALVHIFLPYVVLVLYAGFNPLSSALLESAQDLGANAPLRWRRVILPLMAAPTATAFVFVFVLAAGDYVTPQLIGGTDGVLLGVEVQAEFKAVGNFPLGAATSFLMLMAFVLCYALTIALLRFTRLDRIRWST